MSAQLPLVCHFKRLKDPRRVHLRRHPLVNILVIAVCAVVAGADDFQGIAEFGRRRKDWLAKFLDVSNGVPSHNTFERVFARLNQAAFQRGFASWMTAWHHKLTGKHLAIDGKSVRGSACDSKGFRALHLVNVWATEAKLCLATVSCEEKSNEITALPELLELLELEETLVTIDAMGCQKKIVDQIVERKGDYALIVKNNQETLHEAIQQKFEIAGPTAYEGTETSYHEKSESGHGRQETRQVVVMPVPEDLPEREKWNNLKTIGMSINTRTTSDGETSVVTRYFISSKKASARYFAKAIRGHWGVENNLHWQLDVTFREDRNRVQERNAAANLGVVRRLALNLLQHNKAKLSMAKKRYAATLDTDFLEEILSI